jgi:DNA-binding NarL/FixJ family response regulator
MSAVSQRIRVLIVDDHDMLREGLAAFLRAFSDLELIGEVANAEIARRLNISAFTAKNHVSNVLSKFGAPSVSAPLRWYSKRSDP